MHLTIAMLTYRRNDYLAQVIPELLAQADDLLVRPARDPARPAGSRVTILPLHAG